MINIRKNVLFCLFLSLFLSFFFISFSLSLRYRYNTNLIFFFFLFFLSQNNETRKKNNDVITRKKKRIWKIIVECRFQSNFKNEYIFDIMLFYHFTTAVIWWFHTVWFLFRKTGMICAVVGKAAAALRELPVWFIT